MRGWQFMTERAETAAARPILVAYLLACVYVVLDVIVNPSVWSTSWLIIAAGIHCTIVARDLVLMRRYRRQYGPQQRVSVRPRWIQASWWFTPIEVWAVLIMTAFTMAVAASAFFQAP